MDKDVRVGFIGQGYVGKNYADDFERRGFAVVRYALEEPYRSNKETIKTCQVVFIAVPTPTTPQGFSLHTVDEALSLLGEDSIAVIKSTILPGSTFHLQNKYPKLTLLFSPEFLREATAARDAAAPYSIIVGIALQSARHQEAAHKVLGILPDAPFKKICTSTEAEMIKYIQNTSGYVQIVLFNLFYDLAKKMGAEWKPIHEALEADPDIPSRFANPVHKSGRGAGGHCLIKDFAAFREIYTKEMPQDAQGMAMLTAIEEVNKKLLNQSGKDLNLLADVYGSQLAI